MRRSIVALVVFSPLALAAAVGACTSDDSSPATGSNDSGASNDSTVPESDSSGQIDSASPTDAPADNAAPSGDAGDGGSNALFCMTWDAQVELDAAGYATSDSGTLGILGDGGTVFLPGFDPTLCSIDGDAHAPMTILNNGPCPIDYWWVDYNCVEEYYGTIPSGQQGGSDTFVTHPWRLRATGTEVLLKDIGPQETPDAWTATYP